MPLFVRGSGRGVLSGFEAGSYFLGFGWLLLILGGYARA